MSGSYIRTKGWSGCLNSALIFIVALVKTFCRCGSKTEEPEASRLGDTRRPPMLSWEAEGLFRLRLDRWPLPSSPQPTCSGKSKSTAVRRSNSCTPTGFRSTTTRFHPRPLPRLCTSNPHQGAPSLRSRVSGRMTSSNGSIWHPRWLVSFLALSLRPAAGSPATPPLAAPSRASGTSKLRLGLIRLCTAPLWVGVMPLWTRWSPLTLSRCTGRWLRVKDTTTRTPTHRWAHRPPWATSQTWSIMLP